MRWALLALVLLTGCFASETAPPEQPSLMGPRPRWQPPASTEWQWQLTGKLDLGVDVPVYDVDAFTTTKAEVARLRAAGRRVICYVSVGAFENFRPDSGDFPKQLVGKPNGWPGENWLDIRDTTALEPILAARFELCARKGFDAVEPDNVDGYLNDTGFALTANDQLVFNRMVARLAHQRGMAVGLKNDPEQAAELEPDFDFAVVEECVRHDECAAYQPFLRAGKPVFAVEYGGDLDKLCAVARDLGLSAMRKPQDLGPAREPCRT